MEMHLAPGVRENRSDNGTPPLFSCTFLSSQRGAPSASRIGWAQSWTPSAWVSALVFLGRTVVSSAVLVLWVEIAAPRLRRSSSASKLYGLDAVTRSCASAEAVRWEIATTPRTFSGHGQCWRGLQFPVGSPRSHRVQLGTSFSGGAEMDRGQSGITHVSRALPSGHFMSISLVGFYHKRDGGSGLMAWMLAGYKYCTVTCCIRVCVCVRVWWMAFQCQWARVSGYGGGYGKPNGSLFTCIVTPF